MKQKIGFTLVVIALISFGFWLVLKRVSPKNINQVENKNMIKISSPDFAAGGVIPAKHTCDGENISPGLSIEEVSQQAKSLVLIVDDPDAPSGVFSHWFVWNISPQTKVIAEGATPLGATVGANDFGEAKYNGPCPPSGTHRYFFRIYALDTALALAPAATRAELEKAMANHIIDRGELMARYSR